MEKKQQKTDLDLDLAESNHNHERGQHLTTFYIFCVVDLFIFRLQKAKQSMRFESVLRPTCTTSSIRLRTCKKAFSSICRRLATRSSCAAENSSFRFLPQLRRQRNSLVRIFPSISRFCSLCARRTRRKSSQTCSPVFQSASKNRYCYFRFLYVCSRFCNCIVSTWLRLQSALL